MSRKKPTSQKERDVYSGPFQPCQCCGEEIFIICVQTKTWRFYHMIREGRP